MIYGHLNDHMRTCHLFQQIVIFGDSSYYYCYLICTMCWLRVISSSWNSTVRASLYFLTLTCSYYPNAIVWLATEPLLALSPYSHNFHSILSLTRSSLTFVHNFFKFANLLYAVLLNCSLYCSLASLFIQSYRRLIL